MRPPDPFRQLPLPTLRPPMISTTARTTTRTSMFRSAVVLLLLLVASVSSAGGQAERGRMLVFLKPSGDRHSSIDTGLSLVKKIGQEQGVAVDATEDASAFTD